jgi:hypothetical protein
MPTYLCPRCGGTEVYFADRQQVVGTGYAQEVRWVNTPLCKACTETMKVFYAKGEQNQEMVAVFKIIGKVSIFVLIGLAVLVIFTL